MNVSKTFDFRAEIGFSIQPSILRLVIRQVLNHLVAMIAKKVGCISGLLFVICFGGSAAVRVRRSLDSENSKEVLAQEC